MAKDICDLTKTDDLPASMQKTLAATARKYGKYVKVLERVGRPVSAREVMVGLYRLTGENVSLAAVRSSLSLLTKKGKIRHNSDGTYELIKAKPEVHE